jgi:alpha-L-fucosidase
VDGLGGQVHEEAHQAERPDAAGDRAQAAGGAVLDGFSSVASTRRENATRDRGAARRVAAGAGGPPALGRGATPGAGRATLPTVAAREEPRAPSAPAPRRYAPTLESLRAHPLPGWYDDAKLGIFVHWTMASVPAFAPRERDILELLRSRYDDVQGHTPYVEWYENALKIEGSPVAHYHREHYGDRPYASFRGDFERGGIARFDPQAWAEAFRAAGARYVVFVTKHHDGYCLWPSRVANPRRPGWASPRDCVGELAAAVRARGMRFGVYYSGGLDWSFEPAPVRTPAEVMASVPGGDYPAYADAQVRELIERHAPEVLWNDIAWPSGRRALWALLADYYERVPEGLVNDRWLTRSWVTDALRWRPVARLADALIRRAVRSGRADLTPPRPPHCDVRTPEYSVFPSARREKWECVRGIDKSFGYNRASREEDFLGREALIHSFADIVSKNGNLLLNVGPRGEDAAIPEPQLCRLQWLGDWLATNGDAVYGTRPWRRAEGTTREGVPVRFTAKEHAVHAILLGTPPRPRVTIDDLAPPDGARVELLGRGPLPWRREGSALAVDLGTPLPDSPALRVELGT